LKASFSRGASRGDPSQERILLDSKFKESLKKFRVTEAKAEEKEKEKEKEKQN